VIKKTAMFTYIKSAFSSTPSILQSKNSFVYFSIAILAAKIWLVNAHQVMVTITPHDDLLFINQAYNLLDGKWLGPFNQLTLIKGPFYALFIAISYYLDIPLLVAQQLVYALASFVTILAIYPLVKQKWILFILFYFLLFNPFSYNYPGVGRIFRCGLYASLGLLSLSCYIGLHVRSKQLWTKNILWSLGAGIALSAFWNTREESIWIIPSLLLLSTLAYFDLRRLPRSKAFILAGLYLLPLLILQGTNFTLKLMNQKHYGVFATIELNTPEFKSAYGGLIGVKSDKWRQFFPVVKEVRESVYAVSPTFRELKPFIEDSIGKKWRDFIGADDLPASFFIWALRDSVASAGYYKNGPDTLRFYQKIGDEINEACVAGKLDCKPGNTSLVPAWHREYNKQLVPTFVSVMQQMLSFRHFSALTGGYKSQSNRDIRIMYETVTREKLLPDLPENKREAPDFHHHLDTQKTIILNDIGSGYKKIIRPLFLLSLLIFLISLYKSFDRRELRLFTVVSSAALAGIFSIAFILTILAITSYSEIARAMLSSYPMVLLFIVSNFLDVATRIFPQGDGEDQHSTPFVRA
jgi:hypothetical protein